MICSLCGKAISEDEYVVHWGDCGECFDKSYEAYLREKAMEPKCGCKVEETVHSEIRRDHEIIQCPLCKAAPKMLRALEDVQWAGCHPVSGECPECGEDQKDGHAEDCQIGIAIAAAKGRTQ